MKISFSIPVYRNQGSIYGTYEDIKSVFENSLPEYEFEIIFIDDGSDDGSLREILDTREKDPRVKAITLTRNFGQMAATIAGLKEANGDAVVILSADRQDPVELIPQMVHQWRDGAEIVIGYRTDRTDTFAAKLFSHLAYGLLRMANPKIPVGGFDFELMDRKALDELIAIDIRNRFFQGELLWTGFRTSFIPYVRRKRTVGKSQYNFWKKIKLFIDAFLDMSYLPIRIISTIGFLMSFLSFTYSLMIVNTWFQGETPFVGWAPIMIAILFVGGLILIMLGILGEYIWRIYDEIRKKPIYIVREKFL